MPLWTLEDGDLPDLEDALTHAAVELGMAAARMVAGEGQDRMRQREARLRALADRCRTQIALAP